MKQKLFKITTRTADEPNFNCYECGTRQALIKNHKSLAGLLPRDSDDSFFKAEIVHDITVTTIERLENWQ